jgi:hypothetical protein
MTRYARAMVIVYTLLWVVLVVATTLEDHCAYFQNTQPTTTKGSQ